MQSIPPNPSTSNLPTSNPSTNSFNTSTRESQHKQPTTQNKQLQQLLQPHINSFNALTHFRPDGSLLDLSVSDLPHNIIHDKTTSNNGKGNRLEYWIEDVQLSKPMISDKEKYSKQRQLYPTECRQRLISYKGKLMCKFCWRVNNGPIQTEMKPLGQAPIMVKSNRCHLQHMNATQLIQHKEEPHELGGYFIVNGIERVIRLLILPRRNNALGIVRSSFAKRGPHYTTLGVTIRCCRNDQTSHTNTLHYLTDGNVMFRFVYRKQEFVIPVVMLLKAFTSATDKDIYNGLCQPKHKSSSSTFLSDQVEMMLRAFKSSYNQYTGEQCLGYIGSKFYPVMSLPDDMSNLEIGRQVIHRVILVHLHNYRDKYNLLIFMIQKLYALVDGTITPDNPDATSNHEVLLSGQLYSMYLKEKLDEYLTSIRMASVTELRRRPESLDFTNNKSISKLVSKGMSDIGKKLEYFISTGNIVTSSGMDLQQISGYTIVAEKLNFYRFISHFRCIHRGAFFAELKTTTVRKLLPESWGFLCPVHTPDGTPCGLLNHLSHSCRIVTEWVEVRGLSGLLAELGVHQIVGSVGSSPISSNDTNSGNSNDSSNSGNSGNSVAMSVQLDGRIVGWVYPSEAKRVANVLRHWKVTGERNVPLDLEIALILPSTGGIFPGLFLFSTPCRFMRPVKHFATSKVDMIGSLEQVYMDIACLNEDISTLTTTHQELTPTSVLSLVANLTPFSEYNQSPRNMYQCQMGKQTMGTPTTTYNRRTDNKLYRIQSPQTPIVRPSLHSDYSMDSFPQGTNAVVAVISYTGYDMEDACIINKSAHERGFGYGTVYKSEIVDLGDNVKRGEPITLMFCTLDDKLLSHLDVDGLPFIGARLELGSPFYAYVDETTGQTKVKSYKGSETAYVDSIRLLGSDTGDDSCTKVQITLRVPRPPLIGDKFASRHGQKGVCSQKWPSIDMPFSESGLQPDIIINPHAFPSRMTIGMLIESSAAKAGALHGLCQDSTPFVFTETFTPQHYYGQELIKAGYNYYGNEPMYSGIDGREFSADIYIGVVYYQRLRHMVSDKYQVRTTGPVHNLTRQPVKGRKRGGGIRFGEMERDSLLAHGVGFCLQDRLVNCSDYSTAHVCRGCGSFVAVMLRGFHGFGGGEKSGEGKEGERGERRGVWCGMCESGEGVGIVMIPYVFRYLITELAAMNIRLKMELE